MVSIFQYCYFHSLKHEKIKVLCHDRRECLTVGKTVTKKKFWILDFTGFYCPSEFSGL